MSMELQADPKAKALIFDLDGTLSDSLPIHLAVWNRIGRSVGFVFDERMVYEMTGMPTIAFAQKIVEDNHLAVSPWELVEIKQKSFLESVHLVRPIGQVVSLVRRYHGVLPMAVGTGASRRSATLQLEVLGLTGWFEPVVTADDVTHHKPEPETFLRCAELMQVEPAFCQVFEDGIAGMKAAGAAGMIVTDVKPYIRFNPGALTSDTI